jgi:uncharacterized membrane protein
MTPSWLDELALCMHLLGAFSLASGTVVAGEAFEVARRRQRCAEIAVLLGVARIGAVLVIGATLLASGFGLWLVHLGHWGCSTPWVDAASGLLVAVVMIGAAGGQRPTQARRLAAGSGAEQLPPNAELRGLLDDPVARALNSLAAIALLAIVVLMVVKPGSPHP